MELAIFCEKNFVNWEIPIISKNIDTESINLNREIKLARDVLRISDAELGAAGTSLNYEFIPSDESDNLISIEPTLSMMLDGVKYTAESARGL